MPGPDIRELQLRADAFEKRLDQTKADLSPQNIVWYPYRTMANFAILDKLLTGPRRRLLDLAAGDPVLDIGCADGATSFFLETLGCQVLAVDNCHTNHNQLAGFQALKTAFHSSVSFQAVDLDAQFSLPDEVFGLAFFLGILYHLKNPYYVLEALASRARFCLLSTRVAQRTPLGHPMDKEPLVYLLDPDECNHDSTNHWIFSPAALRRLLHQTGWTVHDFMTTGVTRASEPARGDRDERAFCLLESRVCRRYSVKLLEGWYPLEHNSFRWTARRFSVELRQPPSVRFSSFRFNFRLAAPGPMTLSATINGIQAPAATFSDEGEHAFQFPIPPAAAEHGPIRIDFTVDHSVSAGVDERELALLVPFWTEGLEDADPLLPFQLT